MNSSHIKPVSSSDSLNQSKDHLVDDFKTLLSEGEHLVKNAADTSNEALSVARDKLAEKIIAAKNAFANIQRSTVDGAKKAATATNVYVKDNPWKSVALAGGVGLLLGILVKSRRES